MKSLNTTHRDRTLCPSLFKMRIKPIYDKFYQIRCRRGKDVQTIEVVDATEEEIHRLVANTFRGRLSHPKNTDNFVPATQVQVVELDGMSKQSRVCCFTYTKGSNLFSRPYANIYNLSPREVRIQLEKEIRKQYC